MLRYFEGKPYFKFISLAIVRYQVNRLQIGFVVVSAGGCKIKMPCTVYGTRVTGISAIHYSMGIFSAAGLPISHKPSPHPAHAVAEQCKVNKTDREYSRLPYGQEIWKRKPLSIELSSGKVFLQKLGYIPVRMALAGRAL